MTEKETVIITARVIDRNRNKMKVFVKGLINIFVVILYCGLFRGGFKIRAVVVTMI